MVPDTDEVSVLVLSLAWTCLSLTKPALKSPYLKTVFPTEHVMLNVTQLSPLQFPPDLLGILRSSTPPTILVFLNFPLRLDKLWAVYVLVLEKDGHRPRIYIGSGTESQYGVRTRMSAYDRRSRTGKPSS